MNYLDIERKGGSRTRVSSGQITQSPAASGNGGNDTDGNSNSSSNASTSGSDPTKSGQNGFSGAQITTRSEADFWRDLDTSLKMIIGEENGRKVVINPLSGTVLVRAMPRELQLAKSTVRETDTIVQAENGQVIVIGNMFRHTRKTSTKSELLILLRPVLANTNTVWEQQIQQPNQRFRSIQHPDYP